MGTQLKRGISDVVTTVLIILLALAAVVILWTFLRGEIQKGSEDIAGASECLGLELNAKSCVFDKSDAKATVSVEYAAGNAELIEIRALLDFDGERAVKKLATIPVKNGIGRVDIATVDNVKLIATSTPEQISFAGTIKVDLTGAVRDCSPSSQPIACTIVE